MVSPPVYTETMKTIMERQHIWIRNPKWIDLKTQRNENGTIWNVSMQQGPKAMIRWSDLSPQFFCIDATLLYKFETDKIWINEFG